MQGLHTSGGTLSIFVITLAFLLGGRDHLLLAQTDFPIAYLKQAVPKAPIGPTTSAQCDAFAQEWAQYRKFIADAHNTCLTQQTRIKNARPSRTKRCQYAACDDVHDLMTNRELDVLQSNQVQACRARVQQYQNMQRQAQDYERQRQQELERRREEVTKQFREQYPNKRYPFEDRMDMRARQEAERQELEQRLEAINKQGQILTEGFVKAYELDLQAREREKRLLSRQHESPSPTEEAAQAALREKAEELAMTSMGVDHPLDGATDGLQQSAKNAFEEIMGKRVSRQAGRVAQFLAKHGAKTAMGSEVASIVMDPIRTSEFMAWLDENPEGFKESQDRVIDTRIQNESARRDFAELHKYMQQHESVARFGPGCTSTQPCLPPSSSLSQQSGPPTIEMPTAQRYWGRTDAMSWALENRLSGIPTPFEDPRMGEAGFVTKRGEEWKPDKQGLNLEKCSRFSVVLLNENGDVGRRYQEEWCH